MSLFEYQIKVPFAIGIFGLFLLLPLTSPLIAQDGIENGKIPTEFCEYYNISCMQNGDENCLNTETCSLSQQSDKRQCVVVWENTTDAGVVLQFKGCFYHDPSCKVGECVSNEREGSGPVKSTHYCCCYGNNCNSEFSWDPNPIDESSPRPGTSLKSNQKILPAIILTFGIFVFIVVLTPALFYVYRRQKMHNFVELPNVESTAMAESYPSPLIGQRPIQLVEVKARGRFGAVWKAKYHSVYVAVKKFPLQDKESWSVEHAIYSLPQMTHANLLQFVGVEKREETPNLTEFWLITAYHERGSLYDYLKGNILTWEDLCRIGSSIAQGLAYLHGETASNRTMGLKPSVAHRDFKSKNVLLKTDLTACIADFGLAVAFFPGQMPGDTHGQVGTRRYMAPEVLEGAIYFHRDAFLPIDMYACGLVLWELVTRCNEHADPPGEYRLPFEDEVGLHPTLGDMQHCVVARKKRPTINPNWHNHTGIVALMQMMQECWDHDAEARLTAPCIVERFSMLPKDAQRSPKGY